MVVTRLRLRDFRSYASADVALGERLTVVHGANGAGKTNLLEALYFGCTGRSCRTTNEREVVRFDAPAARVEVAARDRDGEHELSVGFDPGEAKRLRVDGAPVERLLDSPVRPLVSVFLPDRLELVKGPPALRRAHLDQVVAALWPARARRRAAPTARRSRSATRCSRACAPGAARAARSAPGTSSWPVTRSRCATTAPARWSRLLEAPFADAAGELGLSRRGDAALPAAHARRRPRRSSPPSWPSACPSDLERGFTGHGPHRDELRAAARRARAARLRLAGRAAPRAAGAAARRARGAARRARRRPAAAARRRDERARRARARRARRAPAGRRAGRDHDDRPRARPRRRRGDGVVRLAVRDGAVRAEARRRVAGGMRRRAPAPGLARRRRARRSASRR